MFKKNTLAVNFITMVWFYLFIQALSEASKLTLATAQEIWHWFLNFNEEMTKIIFYLILHLHTIYIVLEFNIYHTNTSETQKCNVLETLTHQYSHLFLAEKSPEQRWDGQTHDDLKEELKPYQQANQ